MMVNLVLLITIFIMACSADMLPSKSASRYSSRQYKSRFTKQKNRGSEEPPATVYLEVEENLYLWWRPFSWEVHQCQVKGPTLSEDLVAGGGRCSFLGAMERGYCGVMVPSIQSTDQGVWILTASDANTTLSTNTALELLPKLNLTDTNITVVEGQTFRVTCASEAVSLSFCEIIAPDKTKTIILESLCSLTVYDAKQNKHAGKWTCKFAQPFYLFEYTTRIDVSIIPEEKDLIGVTEYDKWMVVHCNVRTSSDSISYCHITTPTGLDLLLKPGMGYGKYLYWGEGKQDCGIIIPKPLDSLDQGTWRCEAGQGFSSLPIGGYITIGQVESKVSVEYQKDRIFWPNGNTLDPVLLCHINYSIDYCWFRSPNGTSFIVQEEDEWSISSGNHVGLGFSFGDCALKVPKSDLPHASGIWKCHLGLNTGSIKELTASLNVYYAEGPLAAHKKEVGAPLDWPATLGCFTTDETPIKYCRLVRPDGVSLLVSELRNDSSYSYWGDGLQTGQCGISVHAVSAQDLGKWTCAVKKLVFAGSVPEYQVNLLLIQTSGGNLGLWLGVGVGLTLVVAFISLLVYWRWRTRGRSSSADSTSEEDLLSEEPRQEGVSLVGDLRRRFTRRSQPLSSNWF